MGGLSVDGNTLWLSGRYNAEVYAFDTRDGHVLARIKVGKGPHGLAVFPQPGRLLARTQRQFPMSADTQSTWTPWSSVSKNGDHPVIELAVDAVPPH